MDGTLNRYEVAERALAEVEARRGFTVHAIISVVVWAIVIPVNVFVAPEFPWSAFAVGGMLIGLIVHYAFGARLIGRSVQEHQRKVENLAFGAAGPA